MKDPYVFDFIPFREDMLERDIEQALVRDVTKLLVGLCGRTGNCGQDLVHLLVINSKCKFPCVTACIHSQAFDALIRRGHSIVIIEHNMDVVKCADHVIDLGPEGGDKGGYIVATGTPEEVAACAASYTGQFLKEKLQ